MYSRRFPEDRFPYETSFIHFKINEGCLPGSAEEYAGKLAIFFNGLKSTNLLFNETNDITKLSLNDLNLHFERIKVLYAKRTFNRIHSVVNQYYKFLITEVRLPVPPLSWSISTQKIIQEPEVLMLPWEEMARKVIESTLSKEVKLAFLLFSKGWSITTMLKADAGKVLLKFNWTKEERDFIASFSPSLFNSKFIFNNRKGEPLSRRAVNNRLVEALKPFELPHKHGALRDDARIMYIAHQNLDAIAIEKQYGFVLGGRFSSLLLRLAREVKRIENKLEQDNNKKLE